jgi:putative phage-type endonuclease
VIEQGTDAWQAQRRGKVTASKVADVIKKTKSGYSTSRKNYAAQLLCERLTGKTAESFTNAAMQWGVEKEPEARVAYEFMKNATVELVSFVDHPSIAMSGASPDGLVGEDGLVEIKCPNTATHLEGLMSGEIDPDYITQIQWQLACTQRKWCDFVSFDPRLPPHLQLFIKRVDRDQRTIIELETEVSGFLRELSAQIARLPQAPQEIAA